LHAVAVLSLKPYFRIRELILFFAGTHYPHANNFLSKPEHFIFTLQRSGSLFNIISTNEVV
jgi:hypothetical protein